MRSEQEMLDLIVATAQQDERIRVVMMNGSRVNPNARRDPFQDFDIVYLVTEIASFQSDPTWIDGFGERMILQIPEAMVDPPPQNDGSFTYLMQFLDGNRIDLTLFPVALLDKLGKDSLSLLLLDKDKLIQPFAPPSERDYLPQPPTAKAFDDTCNEFWWVTTNVAKGLWREEMSYAKQMMDAVVRIQLIKMLNWQIGIQTDFTCNPGKFGKHFNQYLLPAHWTMLEQTYADANCEHTWDALFAMCDLFRLTALAVGAHFDFAYPHQDDERVSAHLRYVRALSKDVQTLY